MSKELTCYYSGEKHTHEGLKNKLREFHALVKKDGITEEYAIYSNGKYYRVSVNTWDGEGKWKQILTLKDCNK